MKFFIILNADEIISKPKIYVFVRKKRVLFIKLIFLK